MPSEFFLDPLELFVLALLGCLALMKWWPALNKVSLLKAWPMLLSSFLIGSYVVTVIYYIGSPGVFDHGEIMVPAWAWMFATGHPLYNKLDDAARYSTLYGPDGTIFYSWAMLALGPSLFSCKLVAGVSGIGGCLLCFAAFAKRWDVRRALFGTGIVALLTLMFAFQAFMTKADPFVFLFAALALWAAVSTGPLTASIILAICLGVEVNLKVHAFLYILPVLILHFNRTNLNTVVLTCAGSVIFAMAPFLYSRISFSDWMAGLQLGGSEGLGRLELLANVQWLAFFWLPFPAVMLICQRANPAAFAEMFARRKVFLGVLFGSMVLTGLIGSKVGSGPAHFSPFIPLLVYAFCLFLEKETFGGKAGMDFIGQAARACIAAFCAAALFLAAHQQFRFLTAMGTINAQTEAVDADIAEVMRICDGKTVSMGYGSNATFFLSQQLLPLVFANNPLCFEFSAMQGFHDKGLSDKGREVISNKLVNIWLIPRGDQPFTIRSFYQPNPLLFDDDFRASFGKNYQRSGTSRFFDIYAAKP